MHKFVIIGLLSILATLFSIATINNIFSTVMAQGYDNYYGHDSSYSQYPTDDKKYECRTGPFEGFFTSSVEFCKNVKFDPDDRKDHIDRDNKTITVDLYTVVGNTTTSFAGTNSSLITSTAICDAGDFATGGSFLLAGNSTIRTSQPLANERGWIAIAQVSGSATAPGAPLGSVTADVVCIDNPPLHSTPPPPPPPPVENATLSINKEWFACNDDGIDCTVRSESDITFETPSSGNYISCTEQNDNCPFVADTELNIQISGNSPTPNTIPALVDTQASVDIGSGPFNVTESLSNESQSLFPQLPIPVGDNPTGIAYDPENERMYVTNQQTCCFGPDTVSVIDTTTNTVIGTITVGGQPIGIAYDPENERMYVTNSEPLGTVSVIDTTTNMVVGTPIPVGSFPNLIAYDSENERMYVANFGSDTVSVIDTTTNTVIGTPIPAGSNPIGIAYDSENERMYVANFGSGTVSVIDTTTNTVIGTPIPIGNNPIGIAYDRVNERMYVTNSGSDTVSVIDTTTNTVIGTITVGITAGIAYDPVNKRMYVANSGSGTVSVIDTTTNTVIGTPISVGNLPLLLAYDRVNERMYVTNGLDDTVSVLYLSANKVCQDSGFDAGELRTYGSNGQTIEQMTCVNFVGDCSGDIQGGETKECTVQDYAVRVNDISDTPAILAPPNQEINQQQVQQQEMEDE